MFKSLSLACILLLKATNAVALTDDVDTDVCSTFTVGTPHQTFRVDDTTIENTVFYGNPGDDSGDFDNVLKIVGENITLKNVVVYHAANTMGIYVWEAHNLTLENVQVIAYGNEWGASHCPTRKPFSGYDCSNIKVYNSDGLKLKNVYTDSGSRGISIVNSPGAQLSGIVNMNVRGPFPAGQCVQIGKSDGSTLDNFYCHNDLNIAWPEDSISIYRSSDVPVTNGVIEGSNAPTGICLMFEGSAVGVSNGSIENVEARYCQGCFSGYPIDGLYQRNNTCASPVCQSDDPPRGGKDYVNMWTAGDNVRDGIYGAGIDVDESYYYDPCDDSEGRIYWESRNGQLFTGGNGPIVTQLDTWSEKPEYTNDFSWEGCFTKPTTDCADFPVQESGSETPRVNVNSSTGEEIYEVIYGHCWPDAGYDQGAVM